MWDVLASFGIDLTRISHSCEFFRVGPPVVPTVIVLDSGILFSLGYVGKRYMDVATMYTTTESLLLFSIFEVGVADFE